MLHLQSNLFNFTEIVKMNNWPFIPLITQKQTNPLTVPKAHSEKTPNKKHQIW